MCLILTFMLISRLIRLFQYIPKQHRDTFISLFFLYWDAARGGYDDIQIIWRLIIRARKH